MGGSFAALLLGATASAGAVRVAVLPLVPLGTSAEEAKVVERALRREIARFAGIGLLSFEATVERARASPDAEALLACQEEPCSARAVEVLNADEVVGGALMGLGGIRAVSLVLVRRGRSDVRRASADLPQSADEASLRHAVCELFGTERCATVVPPEALAGPITAPPLRRPMRLWAYAATGAAVALASGGAAFGFSAGSRAAAIDGHRTGCPGTGDAYFRCFQGRVEEGRLHGSVAAGLFAGAAVSAAAAALFFAWPASHPVPETGP